MALTADDRLEIHELMNRYAIIGDDAHVDFRERRFTDDDFLALFTEDAEWVSTMTAARGHDGLLGHIRRAAARDGSPEDLLLRNVRHHITNVVIDGDGDEAQVFSYVLLVRPNEDRDAAEILSMGVYEDTVRRIEGRWRIARRWYRPENMVMASPPLRARQRRDAPSATAAARSSR